MKTIMKFLLCLCTIFSVCACSNEKTEIVDDSQTEVTATIPAGFFEDVTQEELEDTFIPYGIKTVTLNEDGSVDIVMTKEVQKQFVADLKEGMLEEMKTLSGSENYPNITLIQASDDMTSYTVYTMNKEFGFDEWMLPYQLFVYGGMYSSLATQPFENMYITFLNVSTDEVIYEVNYNDWKNE